MDNLTGKRVLITSGPTRSYIDAVRYITNSSTGRLGSAIAKEFLKNKSKVTFVYGKDSIIPIDIGLFQRSLKSIEFTTVLDLFNVIKRELKNNKYDIIIHLAGVSDYEPEKTYKGKIKSNKKELVIKFKRTPKILKYMRLLAPQSFFVAFKLENNISKHELINRAYDLLIKNNIDLVVANDIVNINGNGHHALIIDRDKKIVAKANTKEEIAKKLIERKIYEK